MAGAISKTPRRSSPNPSNATRNRFYVAGYLRPLPGVVPRGTGAARFVAKTISAEEHLNDRHNFTGHITGSAIILSPDKKKVLLIHHKVFDIWQQPGGHWEEGEESPLEAARREGEEETGVRLGGYLPVDPDHPLVPLDIDTHQIPARPEKSEPEHYHHDFRFVFIAKNTDVSHQAEEVNDTAWFDLDAPETKRIEKVIKKLKAHLKA